MLKSVAHPSPNLQAFIQSLNLLLNQAQEKHKMLEAVATFIPPDCRVYVLFDSWYAAASLLKWCRAQDWHIICRLKSNRLLNDEQVRHHNQRLKHRRYTRVRVTAADEERPKIYLVRSLTGRLTSLPAEVSVFISKRHNRDIRPRYFCSTDLSLSAHQALNYYHERWGCEVANWYIAEKLGWADCRLWHVESVNKYLVVLWLTSKCVKPVAMLIATWPM